jgi:hypothetical protein
MLASTIASIEFSLSQVSVPEPLNLLLVGGLLLVISVSTRLRVRKRIDVLGKPTIQRPSSVKEPRQFAA